MFPNDVVRGEDGATSGVADGDLPNFMAGCSHGRRREQSDDADQFQGAEEHLVLHKRREVKICVVLLASLDHRNLYNQR